MLMSRMESQSSNWRTTPHANMGTKPKKPRQLSVKGLEDFQNWMVSPEIRKWIKIHPLNVYFRKQYIGNASKPDYLCIANVECRFPGKGYFTLLLDWLKSYPLHKYGLKGIYVESVSTERFAAYLEFQGFKKAPQQDRMHNYIWKQK